MPQNYSPEFKKKLIHLRLEEGRTINSITTEYNISKETSAAGATNLKKNAKPKAFNPLVLSTKRRS